MKTLVFVIAALLIGLGSGYVLGGQRSLSMAPIANTLQYGVGGAPGTVQGISQQELDFRLNMRKFWVDHITWTRMWLVSFANDTGDSQAIATRLLKNQEDIGNAIKPYYGEDAGNMLTALLKEHITLAVEVVTAAKANDTDVLDAANTKWYDNANQIADFLASANPNWSATELRNMMKDHLDTLTQETTDILNKNYESGIAVYDTIHNHILILADTLSSGIVKQFPDKFVGIL